ncbi:MAG: C1 family peptidase, partial [Bacteroidales bacterium]|nr:C1 family peptidase [Bacteroidales bacterium]
MKNIKKYIGWCCLAFFPLGACAQITANPFTLQSVSRTSSMNIAQTFRSDGLHTIDFDPALPVYGMALSGHVSFHDAGNSMVRVTAVCDNGTEYLLYETSPLFSDGQDFDIEDGAMETAVLDAETIVKLNVTLLNATLYLSNVKYNRDAVLNASQQKNEVALVQEAGLIARLNENLEKQGHLWRAGKTSLSGMTYEQKKAVFGDPLPYLGGYEYYIGGIFVMPDYVPKKAPVEDSLFVKEWDWRNRHGKNWMTSVKNQGSCGSCWAFAVVGSIEAYINLYYNKLIKYDLSEQQLVSCFANNGCNGANPGLTLNYIKKNGIVLESCFPYKAQNLSCSNICNNESERIY